mgnify:CR=1 FL=1
MTDSVHGKITRVYTDENQVYIKSDAVLKPKSGYFRLLLTHPNYNAVYSLLLSSAINKKTVKLRTMQDISPTEYGEINYVSVDF